MEGLQLTLGHGWSFWGPMLRSMETLTLLQVNDFVDHTTDFILLNLSDWLLILNLHNIRFESLSANLSRWDFFDGDIGRTFSYHHLFVWARMFKKGV